MPRKTSAPAPVPAGWREWISLPGLGIRRIKAKLDTGARTSALHAVKLEIFRKRKSDWVRFVVHPRQRTIAGSVKVEAPIIEWREIKSSTGHRQERPVIVTDLVMFGQTWPIEVTLTNRVDLGFRMLLGRQALRGRVLVDSGHSYVGGRPQRKKVKKKTVKKKSKKKASKKKAAKKVATKGPSKKKPAKKTIAKKAIAKKKPGPKKLRKKRIVKKASSKSTASATRQAAGRNASTSKKKTKKKTAKTRASLARSSAKEPSKKASSRKSVPSKTRGSAKKKVAKRKQAGSNSKK